jgi:hypothetical protein
VISIILQESMYVNKIEKINFSHIYHAYPTSLLIIMTIKLRLDSFFLMTYKLACEIPCSPLYVNKIEKINLASVVFYL